MVVPLVLFIIPVGSVLYQTQAAPRIKGRWHPAPNGGFALRAADRALKRGRRRISN